MKVAGILLPRVLSDQMSVAQERRLRTLVGATSTDGSEILINKNNKVNAISVKRTVTKWHADCGYLMFKHFEVVRHAVGRRPDIWGMRMNFCH